MPSLLFFECSLSPVRQVICSVLKNFRRLILLYNYEPFYISYFPCDLFRNLFLDWFVPILSSFSHISALITSIFDTFASFIHSLFWVVNEVCYEWVKWVFVVLISVGYRKTTVTSLKKLNSYKEASPGWTQYQWRGGRWRWRWCFWWIRRWKVPWKKV